MTNTARLYGGSLYDLAAEEGILDELMEQTTELRQVFRENPDYLQLLSEPSIAKNERLGLIDQAFGGQLQKYLVNFVKLLCERGLLWEYAGCCEEFARRYDVDHNIARAEVTSAVALTEQQTEALTRKLEKISGKNIRLTARTDPSVLAGLRVELEGKLLDGTVQGRLSGISRSLGQIS